MRAHTRLYAFIFALMLVWLSFVVWLLYTVAMWLITK